MLEKSTYDTNCWLSESESLTIVHPDFSSGYVVDNCSLFHRTKEIECNQMNIYEHEVSTENVQYNLVERNMYGSTRLGTFSEKVNMLEENTSTSQTVTLGYKYFELSNHLGNVLTVIKDIKIPIELEGDDEPFEDPGDAPYFNADGTIRFDQLINHPSHTCVNPGLNFQDFPSSSYPTFEDVNGDGNIDMKVRSEVPIYAFPTRLFFYTTPGHSYTLNFEILSWMNVGIIGVVGMQCGNPFAAGQNTIYTPGSYSYSFIATGAQTEIKWNIFKQQASLPGEITFTNFSFTQGTGPFFSQPIPPPVDPETDISHYEVAIVSVADYSPFGVQLDGRTMESEKYRYGFQNQEKDDEVKGEGNSYDFGARFHDPRLGRWLSVDPDFARYTSISPYVFCINSPNKFIDPNGRWIVEILEKPNNPKQYELVFIAEDGDNLEILALQLGLSQKEILEKHPELEGLTICSGDMLKLEKIAQVAEINNGINFIGDNQSITNCAALADRCDGGTSLSIEQNKSGGDVENYEQKIINNYLEISDSKDSRIGDVITYRLTKSWREKEIESGAKRNEFIIKVRPQALQEMIIEKVDFIYQNERHFSIIVLKDKSGKNPAFVIQKNGRSNFNFKVDKFDENTVQNSGTEGVIFPYNDFEYSPSPLKNSESPIYRNNEK